MTRVVSAIIYGVISFLMGVFALLMFYGAADTGIAQFVFIGAGVFFLGVSIGAGFASRHAIKCRGGGCRGLFHCE